MSIHKTYAVFGLGRYGRTVATELVNSGAEVLALDNNEAIVNTAIAHIPYCKCADVTDPEVIRRLDIGHVDTVIIAMAEHLEGDHRYGRAPGGLRPGYYAVQGGGCEDRHRQMRRRYAEKDPHSGGRG